VWLLLQISDQKLICNWLVKTDQKLTCSAIEQETDSTFAVVINNQVFVCHRLAIHCIDMYTLSQTCQLFFALCLSNMNQFQQKFVNMSQSKHLTELAKLPGSPEICASIILGNLKRQIQLTTQYLRVYSNESLHRNKHDWQLLSQKSSNVQQVTLYA